MKKTHILKFYISIFLLSFGSLVFAQKTDSLKIKKPYSLRLGVDMSKPIISIFDNNLSGLEITGDFRLANRYYIASEIGHTSKITSEDFLNFTTKGSYIKIGANYNAYNNWLDMRNEIFVGIRYGFSTFSQTVNSYTINQNGVYFDEYFVQNPIKYDNLTAHWAEFVLGIKVETFKNLFLGASVSFNSLIKTDDPDNFQNLFIPGFNKRYLNNSGAGFNYTVSYQIPLYKKVK
ncbi:MAG: DUF6048 family protein [Flavobacteriaceae bacterium]|nr:DUF6048 family protein [Flavobacteriaceae bacterium]